MEENNNVSEMRDSAEKVYEAAFLLDPKLGADGQLDFVNTLRTSIEKAGGEYIAHDTPKEMPLAYSMSRTQANKKEWFDKAHFGWIKFAILPSEIAALEKRLASDENVIRSLLVSTVRENTLYGKRLRDGKRPRRERKETREAVGEVDKEAVDKKILELVAE